MVKHLEKEWARVTANPDNVIISDSLRDRLPTEYLYREIENEQILQKICTLKFEDYIITGELSSFSNSSSDSESSYVIIISSNDAMKLVKKSLLRNLNVQHGDDEIIDLQIGDAACTIDVDLQEANMSALTVSIS